MSNLSDVHATAVRNVAGSQCNSKITLAINAASAATVKSTGATVYSIGGVYYTVAAMAAQAITITHRSNGAAVTTSDPAYVQPAETTVIYVLAYNSSGTLAVVQGSYAGQVITFADDKSLRLTGTGGVPTLPAGYVPVGAIKVVTAAATTFTPATTALDAAGVTATYYDLKLLPTSL